MNGVCRRKATFLPNKRALAHFSLAIVLHILLYTVIGVPFLSREELDGELGDANVVGVELVHAEERTGGSEAEGPAGERAKGAELALVDVVVNAGREADVGVDDDGDAEGSVEEGLGRVSVRSRFLPRCRPTHVGGRRRNDSGGSEGDQAGREEALKGPVVRAVGAVGRGEVGRVVDSALEDGCGWVRDDRRASKEVKWQRCPACLFLALEHAYAPLSGVYLNPAVSSGEMACLRFDA